MSLDTTFIKKRVKKVNTYQFWIGNLIRAVLAGVATALLAKYTMPDNIVNWADAAKLAERVAFIKALMYIEKSPLPSISDSTEDEEEQPTNKTNSNDENKTTPPTA